MMMDMIRKEHEHAVNIHSTSDGMAIYHLACHATGQSQKKGYHLFLIALQPVDGLSHRFIRGKFIFRDQCRSGKTERTPQVRLQGQFPEWIPDIP